MSDRASSSAEAAHRQSPAESASPATGGSPRFQTTRWSLIAHAAEKSGPIQRAALEELCQSYWQPVYAFVRRSGLNPEQAEDLTQDFFTDLVDRGPLIGSADPTRGRFRTYLLAAVKHRMANDRRDRATIKRGGRVHVFSIDGADAERRYAAEPVDGWTAEAIFNRRWALTLLERVLEHLALHYEQQRKGNWFEAMRPFLTTDDKPPLEELARDLGTTASTIRVAVHRLRKQYRDRLIAEIASTLGTQDAVADERSELLSSLAGPS